MNKWIAIPVISVLAVALAGGGYFLWQQTTKLGDAEAEIVVLEGNASTLEGNVSTLEGNVSTLESNVSTLEGNVSTLETDLAASEAEASALEADLGTANSKIGGLQADVSAQQTINSSLSQELKKVQDPRHFASLQELADWLHEDDTNTKYVDEGVKGAYILQIRALRDGFLLPVAWFESAGELWFYNVAVIDGNKVYAVDSDSDNTAELGELYQLLPSHPLPLD